MPTRSSGVTFWPSRVPSVVAVAPASQPSSAPRGRCARARPPLPARALLRRQAVEEPAVRAQRQLELRHRASSPSKRFVYSSTAASPRSARRPGCRTRCSMASSVSADQCSQRANALESALAKVARAGCPIGGYCTLMGSVAGSVRTASRRLDDGRMRVLLELERGLVHHQARADVHDLSTSTRLLALRVPPVDTRSTISVGQAGQRRQLHRTVELDQVHVHALGGEVLARDVDVLGRHPQARALAHRHW